MVKRGVIMDPLQNEIFIEGEPFVSRQVFPPFWFWWLFPPRPPGPWFRKGIKKTPPQKNWCNDD
ncbi:hypothetical protein [Thomasclavelia cocleata]|nr:hypothetical protein [Thomasclavelia cocleata]